MASSPSFSNSCNQYHKASQKNICRIADICNRNTIGDIGYEDDVHSYIANTIAASKDYAGLKQNLDMFFEYFFNIPDHHDSYALDLIGKVRQFMRDHMSEPVSLNSISGQVNLNPAYLCRLFKDTYGQTPIEYLTSIRIEHAMELMHNPDIKIRNVAELCGYPDQLYFSKVFKEITGHSPTRYRELYTETKGVYTCKTTNN